MKRVTYSISEKVSKRIDDYNNTTGVPKSTLVEMAVNQYLDSQEMLATMPELMGMMKKALEQRQLDDEFKPMSAEDKADLWKANE